MEVDLKRQEDAYKQKVAESNKLLNVPEDLSEEEKKVWNEIASLIISSTFYKKTAGDAELLRQYTQTKLIRDRTWTEYNKNPERYTRIVTGLCQDGKTPKVMVKENEHYKMLTECNKQLEKLLQDFKLTPKTRK